MPEAVPEDVQDARGPVGRLRPVKGLGPACRLAPPRRGGQPPVHDGPGRHLHAQVPLGPPPARRPHTAVGPGAPAAEEREAPDLEEGADDDDEVVQLMVTQAPDAPGRLVPTGRLLRRDAPEIEIHIGPPRLPVAPEGVGPAGVQELVLVTPTRRPTTSLP